MNSKALLLLSCLFWHHDSIPKALFQNAVVGAQDYEVLPLGWDEAVKVVNMFCDADGSWNDFKFQDAINKLNSFSLITSYFKDHFSLHPLVQSWAQYDCLQRNLKMNNLSGYLLGLAARDRRESNEYLMRIASAPHIKAWLGHQSNIDILNFDLGIKLSKVYKERGWWRDEENLELKVLEQTKQTFGDDHPHTLTALYNLGCTYKNQGRWLEAEQLQLQVVERRKTALGEDHSDTLHAMNDLALTYQTQGRWPEAEQLHLQVMEKRKIILGEDHPDTLDSMNDVALTYQNQGWWTEAEQLHLQELEKCKAVLGEDHPEILISMHNLASTYQNQSRWSEAKQLQLQVMEKRKAVLGEDHPETLSSMNNLASTYQHQGCWSEAEQLQLQVIEKFWERITLIL